MKFVMATWANETSLDYSRKSSGSLSYAKQVVAFGTPTN